MRPEATEGPRSGGAKRGEKDKPKLVATEFPAH